jgi:hypothetical protein
MRSRIPWVLGLCCLAIILALGVGDFFRNDYLTASVFDPGSNLSMTVNDKEGPLIVVEKDSSVEIKWASEGTKACQASGSWEGFKSLSGSEKRGPLAKSVTYVLDCETNKGRVLRRVIQVRVRGDLTLSRKPVGLLEKISVDGTVEGWAYDPDDTLRSIKVLAMIGSDDPEKALYLWHADANVERVNKNLPFNLMGIHGFKFKIPSQFMRSPNNIRHKLYVFGIDLANAANLRQLKGSPRTFIAGP